MEADVMPSFGVIPHFSDEDVVLAVGPLTPDKEISREEWLQLLEAKRAMLAHQMKEHSLYAPTLGETEVLGNGCKDHRLDADRPRIQYAKNLSVRGLFFESDRAYECQDGHGRTSVWGITAEGKWLRTDVLFRHSDRTNMDRATDVIITTPIDVGGLLTSACLTPLHVHRQLMRYAEGLVERRVSLLSHAQIMLVLLTAHDLVVRRRVPFDEYCNA